MFFRKDKKRPFSGMAEPQKHIHLKLRRDETLANASSTEERINYLKEFDENAEKILAEQLEKLAALSSQSNPFQILSIFAYYDRLFYDSYKKTKMDDYSPLEQNSVEFFQAYFLTKKIDSMPVQITQPATILELQKTLKVIADTFPFVGISEGIAESQDIKSRALCQVSKKIRLHTYSIRNPCFKDQNSKHLKLLFKPLDDIFVLKTGIKLSCLVDMWDALLDEFTQKINKRIDLFRELKNKKTPADIIKYYCKYDSTADEKTMLQICQSEGLKKENAIAMCVNYADFDLPQLYTFSLDDFLRFYPEVVNPEALLKVIANWSYNPEDLVGQEIEHIFLNNPIWKRPLVRIGERAFFWPLIEMFQSFGIEMLEELLMPFPDLIYKYKQETRSEYLEDNVEELMKEAFPFADIHVGAKWRDGEKNAENDILIHFDDVLIVVECKSGRITPPTRRGAPKRLEYDIDKLIQDASAQSQRLAERILSDDRKIEFSCKRGGDFSIEPKKIFRVIRLNVTLDFWGPVACGIRALTDAGLISKEMASAPTIALYDLENIFEILDSPLTKLHYLARRIEFERRVDIYADEMDLLTFYLDNGFNIGEVEFDDRNRVMIYSISKQIEPYFFGKSAGKMVKKPEVKLTQWW